MPHHPNMSHPFLHNRFSIRRLSALPTLALNRLMAYAATSMLGLFFPIFLYEFFDLSLTLVFLWYTALYVVRIPGQVIAAKIFSRTGLIPSMVMGTLGAIFFYIAVYLLDTGVSLDSRALLAAAILGVTVFSGFYWTPFHIDFASFSTKGKRGTQVAVYNIGLRIVAVIAPALAGFIVMQYSYSIVFLIGMIIMTLSLFPIMYLPRTHVRYEFGFFETFKKMFQKPYRNMSLSMISFGAENTVGVVAWPLFLFVIFKGQHLEVGLFAAVVVIIGAFIQYALGKRIDKGPIEKLFRYGARVYSLGWFVKAFVTSVMGVFAASLFHTLGSILMGTPFEALYYEKAADSGHYIDEFTVIRESAIAIGRFGMMMILLLVTSQFPLSISFVVAAIVSLGITFLAKATVKDV